ncbi:tetratricopeptide repeat protein [Sporohalobacter salinus]|uniref:tetratricopeptide repeat protein n=1 Tax=Sporohalobacter salinus TaxID=1494606 RepID=UPI00195F449D|nr:tetratricopeptide (TPR) repeat protein [Sporohalobacter salinus]
MTRGIDYGEELIPEVTDSDIKVAVYNNIAILYNRKQNLDKAIDYYTKAIKIDENDYLAHLNRGLTYIDMGEIDKALEDLNKCIVIDERRNIAYYKAHAFYEQNKYKEALEVIKKYRKIVGEIKNLDIKKLEKKIIRKQGK